MIVHKRGTHIEGFLPFPNAELPEVVGDGIVPGARVSHEIHYFDDTSETEYGNVLWVFDNMEHDAGAYDDPRVIVRWDDTKYPMDDAKWQELVGLELEYLSEFDRDHAGENYRSELTLQHKEAGKWLRNNTQQ